MPIETNKINYGGDIMILVNGTPLAFSSGAKLDVSLKTRDIGSKDSGYWDEKAAGKLSWNASSDALMADSDLVGNTPVTLAGAASITAGSATLTVVGAGFVAGDVGRGVTVLGAGVSGADLVTVITGYTSSTVVTLGTAASTTISAQASKFKWSGNTFTYSTLYTLMQTRNPVFMVFASVVGTAPNWTASTTVGKSKFTGTGIITSLSMNAPDGDNATYSFSMEGTSSLTQVIN